MKKNKFSELQNKIGCKFSSENVLKISLTHKSFDENNNNEKLEFLGDRVLGLIISKNLILKYPEDTEGTIDKKYANLVNKKKVAEISSNINLKKYMFLGPNYEKDTLQNEKISGDCLEALIGAIFLDSGFKNAEKFVLKYWDESLKRSDQTIIDSKTKLQEYTLKKFKVLPKYILQKKSGPHHKPTFNVQVQIPNSEKISGSGTSKKNAQQNAAKKLIDELNI